jgi:predicted RNase H-like HicB family nuclease
MTYYVGILDGDKDVWGVSIPDVPGCYGGGSTPEAAIADATSALREVAAHQAANGVALAAPRGMRHILNDASVGLSGTESLVMVPLLLDRGRSVKANISLDAGLLEAIDAEAERAGLTRSSFLASAALDKIERAASRAPNRGQGVRSTHRGSKGATLPAARDEKGQFKDIVTYKRSGSKTRAAADKGRKQG